MKKLLFVASALALTLTVACKKKTTDDGSGASGALTVENVQNTVIIYKTATWCGPCGFRPLEPLELDALEPARTSSGGAQSCMPRPRSSPAVTIGAAGSGGVG